ncbi:hypothetical protein ACIQF8_09145 [Pseudarthrobacter sp. NPDC092184]|uniref:hypothetical protein n=1 Tax=unclassified Pseudarthrobacter TaxID=2647000 RepID=UPI00381C2E13
MSDTAGTRSDAFVDQLLLEAGMDDDGRLRPALLELRALADTAPEPSAAIAALMAPAGAAGPAASDAAPAAPEESPRVDELAARRKVKRRIALTTLSVAVSLSAGGAVAAASDQGIRESLTQLNHTITAFVTGAAPSPAGHQTGQPAAPLPSAPAGTAPAGTAPAGTAPAGAAPSGTAPGGSASVPGDPAEARQPAAAPPSDGAVAPGTPAGQPDSPGKSAEVPAPGAVPGHVADGLGKPPEVPVPSEVPLPGNLPSVPLP